jgi:hypothetical protein
MTKMTKFLALLPVVAFAVGCSGVAPGGPSTIATNDANELAGGASAMSRSCDNLKSIDMAIDESDDSMIWVHATYVFATTFSTPCPAPSWRSDVAGLTVDRANRFRAGFSRMTGGKATVQASGPNGVHNAIEFSIGPSTSDRRPILPICPDVTGVTLSLMPSSTDDTRVIVVASYQYVAQTSNCTDAPSFVADRAGLIVDQKNPFVASIDRMGASTQQTTVTATSPDGISGAITF